MSITDTPEHCAPATMRRVVVAVPGPYLTVQQRFEELVPALDDMGFAAARSRQQRLVAAQVNSPYGFIRWHRTDLGALHPDGPAPLRATEYVIGNYALIEALLCHDPGAAWSTRLHGVLFVGGGVTQLAVTLPSAQLSAASARVQALGHRLDAGVAHLLGHLGARVPQHLGISAGTHYDIGRPIIPRPAGPSITRPDKSPPRGHR